MNYYKINTETNYPMTANKQLDDTWKEFTVDEDGVYSPSELNDAMVALKAQEKLAQEIAEAKQFLANTDYKELPNYEPSADEVLADVINARSVAREFIRKNKQ